MEGQYLAYRRDPDAGPELQYALHHRNYDPRTGVFTTTDPAKDDLNLYRYVRNNPVNQEDPSGLETFMFEAGMQAGESASLQREHGRNYNTAVDSMEVALEGINTWVRISADALQEVERTGESNDELINAANEHIVRLMQLYVERRNRALELAAEGYGYGVTADDLSRYFESVPPPGRLAAAMGDSFGIPAGLQRRLNSRISGESEAWASIQERKR